MRRAAAILLTAACAVEPRAGPGLPGGPLPPIAAHPVGKPGALIIGSGGGTMTLGTLTLTVPAGAVPADTDFTLDVVAPNTATGAVGDAYRIGPAGLALAQPVTLTFAVADSTGLAASHQIALGYWFRSYGVTSTPTTVNVVTSELGDWTLVTAATQRDLHGPFRVVSTTQDVPVTSTGDVTLQFVGEEPGFIYYIPVGTVTPSSAGCDPVPATPLPFSLAEIHAATTQAFQFRWAINGLWGLTCGASTPIVSVGFDTMGIDNHGCALGYTGAIPVSTDPTHLTGQFLVDCGPVRGQVVASWDLVPPSGTPGPLPPP